jgi:hypothetical protein
MGLINIGVASPHIIPTDFNPPTKRRSLASYHTNGFQSVDKKPQPPLILYHRISIRPQRGVASPHIIPTDFNPLIKNRSLPSYHNNGFQSVDKGIILNG